MRLRVLTMALVCLLAVGGTVAYIAQSRSDQQAVRHSAPRADQTPVAAITGARIVFRHTGLDAKYGHVAMVALDDPGGPRAFTDQQCERIYATTDTRLCLSADRKLVTTYHATATLPDGSTRSLPMPGIPSRARLSRDGLLAATTSFVSGDSYADTRFSTRTLISDLRRGTHVDLENFRLVHDGVQVRPPDRNFWGVTFAPGDDLFYATVSWGGHTWLVRGSIAKRTVTTLREDAECPSLSPDGTRVAYKKRGDLPPGQWRLATLDLATGAEVRLAETRSVDDQVEWLDDDQVVYGIARTGDQSATTDVYSVPADGSGHPRLLIKQAWSPAVVR